VIPSGGQKNFWEKFLWTLQNFSSGLRRFVSRSSKKQPRNIYENIAGLFIFNLTNYPGEAY